MNIKKNIPNFLTMVNLALGFIAILINDMTISPLLILAAGLADLSDGYMARVLDAKSPLGKELDSLADLVSFGVAPAWLYYHHVMPEGLLAMVPVVFLVVFSALRLGIFNIDEGQTNYFKGLPTPANGLFFAFLVPGFNESGLNRLPEWTVFALPLLFSWLLVSPIKMLSFKNFKSKQNAEKILIYILPVAAIVLMVWLRWTGIPWLVVLYILLSGIRNFLPEKKT